MSRANCDRNLLLGILALQLNFIDRNALVAAFDRGTSDKTRPLADILSVARWGIGRAKRRSLVLFRVVF